MTAADLDLIVFDLGGVLVHHDGLPSAREWSGNAELGRAEFWQRWIMSPAARAFEAGLMEPAPFARGVIEEFALRVTPEDFLASFRGWISGPVDGAEELLAGLREHGGLTLASLSNTNCLHWDDVLLPLPFMRQFDRHFPSHLTGLVKPDRAVFEHVAAATGAPAPRILLLDDNAANVDGARAAGWQAELIEGVEGARAALARHGLEGSRAV